MSAAEQGVALADPSAVVPTSPLALWRGRKFILLNVVTVSLLALVFSLLLPNRYRASAMVLPSSAGGAEMAMGASAFVSPLAALGFGTTSEEINNFISILKSRRLREAVIHEFSLMETYKVDRMEDALELLDKKIDIEVTDEGALIFSFLHRDKLKAQAVTAAILRELESTTISLGTMTGERNRRFIFSRIESVQQELAIEEQAMQAFTVEYGTYDLPVQLAAMVEQLVEIELDLARAEIEYNVASVSLDARHPRLEFLRAKRDETSSKLEELMSGESSGELIPNLRDLPNIAVQYARHRRDIEILGALLQFLYPQYEQARLKEAREEPTLHVLDFPRVPQKKDTPHRTLIVLASGVFSLLVSTVWVGVRPYLQPVDARPAGDT